MSDANSFQPVPIPQTDEEGEPLFLRLNIGGQKFMILYDAILRADQTSFLNKFLHLTHPARTKVCV